MSCGVKRLAPIDHTAADYRAECARMLDQADKASDPNVRSALLEIARYYERLAGWTQQRRLGKSQG
jgi:hypothetical protein